MKKLLLGLAISLATLTPLKSLKAQPVADIPCSAHSLSTSKKYLTNNYRVYECQDPYLTGLNSYYYFGGMRKYGVDHYILLHLSDTENNGWVRHYDNGIYRYTVGYGYITIRKNGVIINQEKIHAVKNY